MELDVSILRVILEPSIDILSLEWWHIERNNESGSHLALSLLADSRSLPMPYPLHSPLRSYR